MSKQMIVPRVVLGALAAGLTVWSGQAMAQSCLVSVNDPACYHLKGSDTLHDIITQGINAAQAAGVPGAINLFYDGTGSGNAESQMTYNKGSGTPVTGASIPLGVQSIGPMSRNFRPKFVDAGSVGFVAADGISNTKIGHAAWAPTCNNVVGLDAAIFLTKATGKGSSCKDLKFPTVLNAGTATDNFYVAVPNAALPAAFTNSSAFNNTAATVNYSSILSIILGGVDGSGTIQACADQRRVQAIQDLASCMGVSHLEHLFRRDDNSGTTNTWQDRIITLASSADPHYPYTGGRFCNGQSIGSINSSTPQQGLCSVTRTTTCLNSAACPAGETCQFNLNNQDLDPIRFPCSPVDATHAPTTCTDQTTGKPCAYGDGNANCTQGFIVAITDYDPGSSDETVSIANRVANDSFGFTVGYTGLEATLFHTKGLTMNGTGYSVANVRNGQYLLSRRLFLQNSNAAGDTVGDLPSDTAGPNIGTIVGQGAAQFTAEQNFFNWATTPANLDPIVSSLNFVTCSANPVNHCSGSTLCSRAPAAAVPSPLSAYLPSTSLNGGGVGGAVTVESQGQAWNGSSAAQLTCSSGAACLTGTCDATGHCPLANGRVTNSACVQASDCASNACADYFAYGNGTGLLCQ